MMPDAWLTTPWATSNMPITMFQVLVTIRMAQAVLKIQRKNTTVSMSWKLFLSMRICTSSRVMTKARITPATGSTTFCERVWTMLKMLAFHAWGVLPTWEAMSPTFSFTLSNIPDRLPMMPLIKIPFSHSAMGSNRKPIWD